MTAFQFLENPFRYLKFLHSKLTLPTGPNTIELKAPLLERLQLHSECSVPSTV